MKELAVVEDIKNLQDFVFQYTSKTPKPQSNENGRHTGKSYGLPKKYQYSIGTRMQNYAIDLRIYIDNARFDREHRMEHLQAVLTRLGNISSLLELCLRNNLASYDTVERGLKLIAEVRGKTIKWRENTKAEQKAAAGAKASC